MAQKETAEQKLLKIIEASKKAKAVAQAAAQGEIYVDTSVKKTGRKLSINVQQVNIFLVVCMVASFLFLGHEINNGMSLLRQTVELSADGTQAKDAVNAFVPQLKSVAYYLDKSAFRNIFMPYQKEVVAPAEPTVTNKVTLEKKMAKFKIVGIAWLDVPESATVMLEDTSTRMTYFLKEGNKVEDIMVKTIYTDRVVFSHANEEITIKL